MAARGMEIRLCDDVRKGMGAFATRRIAEGSVIGIYWGERLTARAHALRHGWRLDQVVANPTKAELAALNASMDFPSAPKSQPAARAMTEEEKELAALEASMAM